MTYQPSRIDWELTVPDFPFDHSRTWKVAASAGCGKSYQIKKAIEDLVFKRKVDPAKIMYIVFNKKPADEFIEKLRIEGIIQNSKQAPWMGTFSATCLKLIGVKVLDHSGLHKLGAQYGMDFREHKDDEKTDWDKVMDGLQLKIHNEIETFDPYERKLLEKLKIEESDNGFYTFFRISQIAILRNAVPVGIEYVFIDEAQDNSKLEYRYFEYLKTVETIKGIMLVGDDKQAINSFKGGRWDLFLDFEAERNVCLGMTYRCAPQILKLANAVARPILNRSPLTEQSNVKENGSVEYYEYLEDSIRDMCDEIKKKHSVYVLYRAGEHIRNQALFVLNSYNVPVHSVITDRVLKTFHAMRAAAARGFLTINDLMSMTPSDQPMAGEMNKTAYWHRGVLDRIKEGKFSLDIESEIHQRIEYENLFWGKEEVNLAALGFSDDFWKDIAGTLHNRIPRGIWRGVSDDQIVSLEQKIKTYGIDMGYAVVSTVHSIKGGEADTVILLQNVVRAVEDTEQYNPDEERRVWYVGITRAKTRLMITKVHDKSRKVTSLI